MTKPTNLQLLRPIFPGIAIACVMLVLGFSCHQASNNSKARHAESRRQVLELQNRVIIPQGWQQVSEVKSAHCFIQDTDGNIYTFNTMTFKMTPIK